MATFVSKGGVLHPAKENVALTYKGTRDIKREELTTDIIFDGDVLTPGSSYIYAGPDREALREIQKEGGSLGTDFRSEPEFLQAIRNQGFNTVKQYLSHIGYDEKQAEEEFNKKASVVKSHEVPEKVNAINVLGGGKDFAGSDNQYGGFGKPKDVGE